MASVPFFVDETIMAFVGYLTIFSCFLQLPEGEWGECFDGGVPDHLRRFDHASRVRIRSPLLYLGLFSCLDHQVCRVT